MAKRNDSIFYRQVEMAMNNLSYRQQEFTKAEVMDEWEYHASRNVLGAVEKAHQGYGIASMIRDAVRKHLDARLHNATLDRSGLRRYLCYKNAEGKNVWKRTEIMKYADFQRVYQLQQANKIAVEIRLDVLELVMDELRGTKFTFAQVEAKLAGRITALEGKKHVKAG